MWKFITVPDHSKYFFLWACGSCVRVHARVYAHTCMNMYARVCVHQCACANVRSSWTGVWYETWGQERSPSLAWSSLRGKLEKLTNELFSISYCKLEIRVGSNQATFVNVRCGFRYWTRCVSCFLQVLQKVNEVSYVDKMKVQGGYERLPGSHSY